MKKLFPYIFVFVNSFCFCQDYNFTIYNQENGLPQPYVYDIVQAKTGFLYVATGDGLGVYSGGKFKSYKIKDGLAENFCSALFFDSKQILWIGHFEGGITFLDNSGFHKIAIDESQASKIVSFAEDNNKNIYFATNEGKIFVLKDNKAVLFNATSLSTINDFKIKDNIIYLGSSSGLIIFNLNQNNSNYQIVKGTQDKNITCIDISGNNLVIVGSEGEGIIVFEKEKNELKEKYTITKELQSQRYGIKNILLTNNNQLWVSVYGEGLRMVTINSEAKTKKFIKIDDKNGLKSSFIHKIFLDQEENLWFGSVGSGLFQYLSDRFELYNKNNFLPFDNIKLVLLDDSNTVLISDGKQLFSFNSMKKEKGSLITLFTNETDHEIRSVYLDKEAKNLFLGTTNGILVYQIKSNSYVFSKKLPEFENKIINYITKNLQQQYLVCATDGLYFVNQDYKIEKQLSTNSGLPHNNVTGCFIDHKDNLWIFSPETPLYNIFADSVVLFKGLDSITSYKFTSATLDKDNQIWFGTEGDGIFCLDHYKRFKHFTTNNGLNSDFIYGIGISDKGDIIACHKNGISIKYQGLKKFRPINKSGGLPSTCINNKAIVKDKFGNFWLGSTEGLIKYNTAEDKINYHPPVFNLLRVTINNVVKNTDDTLFKLPYGDYELNIDYIGVSLTNPTGVSYRYKLEGFDNKWEHTTAQTKTYSKLMYGEYRFIIYSTNMDGFENPVPTTFSLVIEPPFWNRVWFYIALFNIICLVFYFILKWKLISLRNAKENLERVVNEKTSELISEKEKVERSNLLLETKNEDILSSIAYAKRIQNAILPSIENMKEKMNVFVLYKPRDIVSGDFYWYQETKKYYYIAVVDCTGHGVPGAFMSLLASTYLDQILLENKEPLPSQILTELDKKIWSSFKQKSEDDKIRDGMDMALCRIEKQKNEMIFSGANRPLYFYSNNNFTEVKTAIYSIGGVFEGGGKGFVDSHFVFKKSDSVYLFSDGFGDQFGGPKNKRYSTKRMKKMFDEIHHLSILEQFQTVSMELESWKGSNEQIDDVLLIGIKF